MQPRKVRLALSRPALTCLFLALWLLASDSPALAQLFQPAVYSADSKLLATPVGKEGVIVLWAVPSGKQRQVLKGQPGPIPIQFLSFSPDGKLLAAFAQNATSARVWDTVTGKPLPEIGDKKQRLQRVVIAPDHQSFLLLIDNASAVLWPSATRSEMPAPLKLTSDERPAPNALWAAIEYSPDSKTLATQAWDGVVKLWNAQNGRELATFAPMEDKKGFAMPRLAFAPDGKSLLAQSMTGPRLANVSLWDVDKAAETLSAKSLQVRSLHELAFSADGKNQALCVATDKVVNVVLRDPASGKQRVLAELGPSLLDNKERNRVVIQSVKLAFSPDGKHLLASIREGGDSQVKIWDLTSGELLATKDGANPRLTADGRAVVVGRDGGVKVHELHENTLRYAVRERHMAIAPDGRTFFSMNTDGTMTLWNTSKDTKPIPLILEK